MTSIAHIYNMKTIDKSKTIANVKVFISGYEAWHLQQRKIEKWGHQQPLSSTQSLISDEEIAKVTLECQLRLHTLEVMRETDSHLCFLADLLEMRYIKRFQVKKTCEKLADLYCLDFISDRSLGRYQNEALLEFGLACPLNLIVHN